MPATGDIIDQRFEVIEIIGSGGLADVYKVRHLELGSVYALKLLTWRRAKLAERMVLEGRIQAQLKHPNIVAVVDLVRHEGQVGLLMEYIDGDTLEGLMIQGPMPTDIALRLFSGVLSAVDTAHRAGVLHRDLKPANILMARAGSAVIPKVADFGLAKVVMDTSAGLTKSGMTMGTPGYLAPEQLSDASTAGVRADVFALGIILHEMLAGLRAYAVGADGHVAVHATASDEVPHLTTVLPDLPATVADAVACAVDRDPEARFATCAAFAHALYADHPSLLEPFTGSNSSPAVSLELSGAPSQPSGSDATYQVEVAEEPSPPSRSRVGVAMVASLVTGIAALVAVAAVLWVLRSPEPVPQEPPAPAVAVPAPEPVPAPLPDPDTEAAVPDPIEPAPEPAPEPVVAPVPEATEPAPVEVEHDTEAPMVEPDTEAVAPEPEPVVAPEPVADPEPVAAPEPVPYPSIGGTWLGTAGRQRMSLSLDGSGGTVSGTLTLTLGPTVRTEAVSGTLTRDGRLAFTAGDLEFAGSVRGDALAGTYMAGGRDRSFDWAAQR